MKHYSMALENYIEEVVFDNFKIQKEDYQNFISPIFRKIATNDEYGEDLLGKEEGIIDTFRTIYQLHRLGLDKDDYDITAYNLNFIDMKDSLNPTYDIKNKPHFVPQIQIKTEGFKKILKEDIAPNIKDASNQSKLQMLLNYKKIDEEDEVVWQSIVDNSDALKMLNAFGESDYNHYLVNHKKEMIEKREFKSLLKDTNLSSISGISDRLSKLLSYDQSYIHKDKDGKWRQNYVDNELKISITIQQKEVMKSIKKHKISFMDDIFVNK